MKIGVIGDVHLGASYSLGRKDHQAGINTRLVDYSSTLIKTIESLIKKGCTQIIFTGDIFEHRTPSVKQQELFSVALRYAIEGGIECIHIIAGNHDQQRITGATTISYIKELPLPNIHVYDDIDLYQIEQDSEVLANLIFVPFRDRKWLNTDSTEIAVNQIDEMITYCLSSIDNDAAKICVGHMTIEGTLHMLDLYADLYNSNDLLLPINMFRSIDITIMGHVHTPAVISKNPLILYSGSMEKRGAFENHEKKYLVIDLDERSVKSYSEPCRLLHDIVISFTENHNEGLMKEIMDQIDTFAQDKKLEDSIVRLLITIMSEDDKFFESSKINSYLRDQYSIYHCVEIKPSLIFSRQVRDSSITETSTDTEAFAKYIDNTFKDNEFFDEILKIGLDIIEGKQ
jgi:exonuclease SbcD